MIAAAAEIEQLAEDVMISLGLPDTLTPFSPENASRFRRRSKELPAEVGPLVALAGKAPWGAAVVTALSTLWTGVRLMRSRKVRRALILGNEKSLDRIEDMGNESERLSMEKELTRFFKMVGVNSEVTADLKRTRKERS